MWHNKRWPLSVAVLAGGDSSERAVSLASGREIAEALRTAYHRVERIDPMETPIERIPWQQFDVCFLALHGGSGEDGRVQRQLDQLGVPYTGSGPEASRLAMSKSAAKERFFQRRVPTQPYILFHATEPPADVAAHVTRLGWPLVIKPDSQGSSLGVGFASNTKELEDRVAEGCAFDPFLLAEPWIDGREFTVAVLGREPLPVLEIATPRGLFDYESKYQPSNTEFRFDTGLPAEQVVRLQSIAVSAAAALGTTGLVRVDIMLDRQQRPWVLEVNTLPGMTRMSLAPRAAAKAGLDLVGLCEWMLRDSLPVAEAAA
ncbi:MAG TPA: D-alanine--D-alanine ligase [Pirellulales bacterium]|jgi:D-alanine-D-alanine ligase|nr:D-alanine--D-alanine ligase [Pirellulales bacterium]